jgi:ABC-type amino acid transport substrate-binding protein
VIQLFKMLESNRIDIAVDVGVNGQDMINQLNLKNIGVVSELAKRDFYNALIQSKAHLAPQISSVIRMMKASGELSKLIRRAEKKRLSIRGIYDGSAK